MQLTTFMGLRFLDQSIHDVADMIVRTAKSGVKQQVYFVNAHCVNVASRDPDYADVLHSAPFVFADGIGVAIAARLWGMSIRYNVNGTDLFPVLCEKAAAEKMTFALFGSKDGIAADCARIITNRYPGLQVVWIEHGYLSPEQEAQCVMKLNASGASMLFVAKGVPAQELWIRDNAASINVPVMLGVGALFDFYSGAVRRAPLFLRNLRLEWLFRLLMEPTRMFRRYVIGNPQFIFRAIRHRIVGN
jgi:exopolysaccharide biosynthesis WecB/TagA/CpsF family protein